MFLHLTVRTARYGWRWLRRRPAIRKKQFWWPQRQSGRPGIGLAQIADRDMVHVIKHLVFTDHTPDEGIATGADATVDRPAW